MVKAFKGVLIECDPATKAVILDLRDKHPAVPIVLEELDATHVFVDGDAVRLIRNRLDELQRENSHTIQTEE